MKDWRGGLVEHVPDQDFIVKPPDVIPFNSYAGKLLELYPV